MNRITLQGLMMLEDYDKARDSVRESVLSHKKHRIASIGPDVVFCFEDRITILYQIQEMLRVERIYQQSAIQDELDAYNPLIPDGSNWKATMMIQIPDVAARREALVCFVGIERCCWVEVADCGRIYAIADEDMERTTEEKTSSVHFLRFELPSTVCERVKEGGYIAMGIDHSSYRHSLDPIPTSLANSLQDDLS